MAEDMDTGFSYSKYSAAYKAVRNYYRKYPVGEVIDASIRYINQPKLTNLEQLQLQPWLFLLLIKWCFGDHLANKHTSKTLTPQAFQELLRRLEEFSGTTRLPSDYESVALFMRAMATQQFDFQRDLAGQHFARQSLLFGPLQENHSINVDFENATGLSILEYLELSFMTFVRMIENDYSRNVPLSHFNQLTPGYGAEKINNYVNLVSKNFDEMRRWVMDVDNASQRTPSRVFEPSIFSFYPFLRTNNTLISLHPQLFYRSTESFVYDTLGRLDRQKFMSKFGGIFERYVSDSLTRAGIPFRSEAELEQTYGTDGQKVDFLVDMDGANIFIECKAGATPIQGMVGHTMAMIADKIQNSALKAIDQAHDMLNKLEDDIKDRNNYLLVVTYKEQYLGNGKQLQNELATFAVNRILAKYQGQAIIPMENIYVLNISDLDFLLEIIRLGKIGLVEAIEKAKATDANPETKLFFFAQHLMEWKLGSPPQHLTEEFDNIFANIMQKLHLHE